MFQPVERRAGENGPGTADWAEALADLRARRIGRFDFAPDVALPGGVADFYSPRLRCALIFTDRPGRPGTAQFAFAQALHHARITPLIVPSALADSPALLAARVHDALAQLPRYVE